MNLFTLEELAKKIPYSKHTLYRKKKQMTEGIHYFQEGNGKILFCDEAVNFFTTRKKGTHENKQRDSFQEKRQSIPIHKYFN